MKNNLLLFLLVALMIAGCGQKKSKELPTDRLNSKLGPNDHHFMMRAYPDQDFNMKAFKQAMTSLQNNVQSRFFTKGFDGEWETQGPGNIGARINSTAIHPTDPNTIYAGFSHGGIFKTTNGGADWTPIFDDQAFLSIGVIEIDPNNPDILYVGTGDVNIPGGFFIGNGIYKSEDAGATWKNIGLSDHGIISKIEVHPKNSNILYAGAMGIPSINDNNRGLYKSEDEGETWAQVLFVSEDAGVIDIILNPDDANTAYVSTWDRFRTDYTSYVTGDNAGIWKTIDGGQNWENLIEEYLDGAEMGRIGLTMSATNFDKITAILVGPENNDLHSIIQTSDGGDTWEVLLDAERFDAEIASNPLGGFGWYFAKIRMNPADDNDIFFLGVDLWRSLDNGETWERASPRWWEYIVHADKHDLDFTENGFLLSTDGGLYNFDFDTEVWTDIENIPATQFYRVAYNPHRPDLYYGGAQDNGTTGGNRDSINNWPRLWGGDGFQAIFHPTDPNIYYFETQRGNINVTIDGGENWLDGNAGLDGETRNWDMPYILSPHDPNILYAGTDKLFRSDIGPEPFYFPMTDTLTDFGGNTYHTISTLDESPLVVGQVYVGTTDGNVWRTQFNGIFHESVNISSGLPDRYVTSIKASPTYSNTVFVTHSGYRANEYLPRIHRSEDGGSNWIDISSNLPDIAINDVYLIPERGDSVIFVATDGGVYGTVDAGSNWERLGVNMPIIPVNDLEYNVAKRELVAATYARSIQSYDLNEILDETSSTVENEPFDLKTALKVFPNPAEEFINIEFFNSEKGKDGHLVILDTQGKVVAESILSDFGKQSLQIDVSSFPAGNYFAKLKIRHRVETIQFSKM